MKVEHADGRLLLEGFVLGALEPQEAAAVTEHLAECGVCRGEAEELAEVVVAICEGLAGPSPSPLMRERVLSGAAAERRRGPNPFGWLRPQLALAGALVAMSAGATLLAFDAERRVRTLQVERDQYVTLVQRVHEVERERDDYLSLVQSISQGGRWWYMAGSEEFGGSGGTLIVSRHDGQAFVLFHDLAPVPQGARYTIWLIGANGKWVRGANFMPSGEQFQRVSLPLQVADFVQCAVTLEPADTGWRAGPLVMQSRIFTN